MYMNESKKLFEWNFRRLFRIRRNHKDVLFVRLFRDKKNLLSLYNALNSSHYTDENDLYINTLDDLIYISVKFYQNMLILYHRYAIMVRKDIPLKNQWILPVLNV